MEEKRNAAHAGKYQDGDRWIDAEQVDFFQGPGTNEITKQINISEYPVADVGMVDRQYEIMNQMADLMPKMMAALKENNERLAQLEKEMRLTVTLNRRQCTDLNQRIRARSQEVATQWHLRPGAEKTISTEIRRVLRSMTGVTAMQDMPGCDYETYQEVIQTWDDYKTIKNLR